MAEELWEKYFKTRDEESRNALVEEYLSLVKQVAGRLSMGLPPHVDEEDFVASGVIGLLEALERYNPSFEVDFKTFATWRIRGAMLDELRKLSWSPRSLYQRSRRLQEAEQMLGHRLGRDPSIEELAEELGWTPSAVEQIYAQMNSQAVVSLEALLYTPPAQDGADEPYLSGGPFISPEESLDKQERRALLEQAIEGLSERERLVLALYYKEELTLKEIGKVLEVSTARVSQLHARAIRKLKEKMSREEYRQ